MSSLLPSVLDRFIPVKDAGARHEITIHAPAKFVLEVARNSDIESIPTIRALFWLRARLLGARAPAPMPRAGLVSQMLGLGWTCLAEEPGHFFVAGAACQPWRADVVFTPIAPGQFADHANPDEVKIAWTLEADELGPELTRFATETRVVATDDGARAKFRGYWRKFGAGIVMIRLILLPVLRRRAESLWQAERSRNLSF